MSAQWITLAVAVISALAAVSATIFTYVGSRRTAAEADERESRKLDKEEYETYVASVREDLNRKNAEMAELRNMLAAEYDRNLSVRGQLQACLDETAAVQAELRSVRAQLAEEQHLTAELLARIEMLEAHVERLRSRLLAAGLDVG